MTRIERLTEAMREHTRDCAPGSECTHWQDFVADCVDEHGHTPWAMVEAGIDCTEEFVERWSGEGALS